MNIKHAYFLAGGALLASVAASGAHGETVGNALQSLTDAIVNGQVNLGVRYRYEHASQERPDSILHDANAHTVRTNLGWRTGLFHGFSAYAEAENVSVIGNEDYNNTYNGKGKYPVVADPDGTEVNQAYLAWQGVAGNLARYGRQAINFDNQRFVGDVGWRQNQQTVDGFTYQNTMLADVAASYAYIYNVNRIFGEDTPNNAFANTGDFQ
ncbi:MAG: alginate export family protein, partial [Immundisolibacter sp.]|uniref:alginate export family protein n=1 Tax=Immundisolibacter sp. TaxID=1934948 RepID=UPI003EE1E583